MTLDFQKSIKLACIQRNDDWANEVLGRIEYASDLPAVEARYHQTCCSNFRSGYKIPRQFQSHDSSCTLLSESKTCSDPKKGRPVRANAEQAFRSVMEYFEEHENGQLTINDMVNKMGEYCGEEAYSNTYMKKKIQEHFGDSILITEINGTPNIVTFKSKGHSILHKFYTRINKQDPEAEKRSIIQTAAKLILSDINAMDISKDSYTPASSISSLEENMEYIPSSLRDFLQQIVEFKDSETVIASIGQAIIQAAMPRKAIAPVQIGLAVQLHYHFGSKFLIDVLNAMGFCSSYQEVQKFETSAATVVKPLLQKSENQFMQFIGDNVDHNPATIDGHDTFHGMGIIATFNPKVKRADIIPRIHTTSQDLIEIGKINIQFYRQPGNSDCSMDAMVFKKLTGANKDSNMVTGDLDFLISVSRPLRQNTPGWSGVMQAVQKGSYPGQTEIVFLPLIDLNPSDLSCIYSTLMFVAKESTKLDAAPVITFDQPLYWKAVNIVENEPSSSKLKKTVVRLGAFHTEMCFLGCIGHLMENSGLSELLSCVYAPNTVVHMLNGKAVGRAVRGHFLVCDALSQILAEKSFPDLFLNTETDNSAKASEENDDGEETEVNEDSTRQRVSQESNHPNKAVMEGVLKEEYNLAELKNEPLLSDMKKTYENEKLSVQESRTGALWTQYLDMIEILKHFIAAERTGNWREHLSTLESMLPYFAAAGHNLYLKSSYVYLQQMSSLQQTHPEVYNAFLEGNHVVRRSERFWGGLSTDLTIEQTLMRSLKSVGGMTRGRGMTEAQRAQWILSMPACADMNSAMQELTTKKYQTSEQHKDSTKARIERDIKDRCTFFEFLTERNPFEAVEGLVNIDSGVFAEKNVNADKAKDIGDHIISQMEDKVVCQYKFKRTKQAVTMGAKSHLKIDGEECAVDPQLLFQRLVTISDNSQEDTEQLFKYELSKYPAALFEQSGLLRQSQKSQLASSLWELGNCAAEHVPEECTYVLDGGSLLQRIPWTKGATFDSICESYCQYIEDKKYQNCHVVFDGYPSKPTTKDITHERRTKGKSSVSVAFKPNNPLKSKKDAFLGNTENKQHFISLLGTHLTRKGYKVHHAEEDADLLVAVTAVLASENNDTVVIGEDTDLLVLLCYHANLLFNKIIFKSDASNKQKRMWDIKNTKTVLGERMCELMLILHAFSGCDTVSRVFGFGKPAVLKKAKQDREFSRHAGVFITDSTPDEVKEAGEQLFIRLYNGQEAEGLDKLRYRHFLQKVSTRNTVVQVQSLPPTESAAKYHSFRTYSQVQYWIHGNTRPEEWGWTIKNGKMMPVMSDLPPAPDRLLKIIKCNCRVNCDTKRCSCRKHGLSCTAGCGECKGTSCSNVHMPDENLDEI